MVKTYKNYLVVVADRDKVNIRDLLLENGVSRKLFLRLYNEGRIKIEGKLIRKGQVVNQGDEIFLEYLVEEDNMNASNMDIDIVYEDTDILILNKKSREVSHPIKYYTENTLLNGVKYYFKENNIRRNPRLVNRLDKDTEGLIIVAKNPFIDSVLSEMIKQDKIIRRYIAVVDGVVKREYGVINEPIFQVEGNMKRIISEHGQNAVTEYRLLKAGKNKSLVEASLKTGRSHQIRVHLDYLGHPILNDSIYGNVHEGDEKMMLCSYYLEFIHPINKNNMIISLDKSKKEYIQLVKND